MIGRNGDEMGGIGEKEMRGNGEVENQETQIH
jgi:hypothetical protein